MDVSTLMIRKDLVRRLDRIARRAGLSTTALANLWLEAAVNGEERWLARDQRVIKELEAILVRAILNGDYNGNVGEPQRRHQPPQGE
jgi:predicted transcriptional regulator